MELVPTILILSQIRCETTCALVIQSYIFCTAQIPLPIGLRCSMYSVYMKNLGVGNCSMYSVFYKLRKAQDVIKTSS